MDVGQTTVDAVVAEDEFFVIDAKEVQDGGVDVVAIGRSGGGFVRPFVAFAEAHAAFDAAADEPVGKCEWIMVAAFGALSARHAAEFGSPQNNRVIEQSAGF